MQAIEQGPPMNELNPNHVEDLADKVRSLKQAGGPCRPNRKIEKKLASEIGQVEAEMVKTFLAPVLQVIFDLLKHRESEVRLYAVTILGVLVIHAEPTFPINLFADVVSLLGSLAEHDPDRQVRTRAAYMLDIGVCMAGEHAAAMQAQNGVIGFYEQHVLDAVVRAEPPAENRLFLLPEPAARQLPPTAGWWTWSEIGEMFYLLYLGFGLLGFAVMIFDFFEWLLG